MKDKGWVKFALLMAVVVAAHLAPHKQWGHGDEFNQWTAAWLVGCGWVPHRDFFSHHPAFPFWFAAPATRLLGAGEAISRAAMLLFYILALALVFHANRRSTEPFSFGLFAVFIALGHVVYRGHLFLADFFFAFAVLVIFSHYKRFDKKHPLGWGDWAIIGLAVFASLGSTLVASYPLAVLAIGFTIKYLRIERRPHRFWRALAIAAVVAAPTAAAIAYLWAAGALRDFLDQVLSFSIRYYRADTGYSSWPPALAPVGFLAVNGGRGLSHLAESALLRHGGVEAALAWANIAVVVALCARGRVGRALFYLPYLLSLMLRLDAHHEAPYVVQSLWAAAWLLRPVADRAAESWRAFRRRAGQATATGGEVLLIAATVALLAVLARAYVEQIAPERHPEPAEREVARLCARLTSPWERIAVFPNSPDIYIEADRKPALASFSYLPWLDADGRLRHRMIEGIENQRAKLLVINWWVPPGAVAMRTFAPELRDAIRRNYRPLSVGVPRLYGRNASFNELLGRLERVEPKPVIEIPERNLLPLAVGGAATLCQFFSVADPLTSAKLDVLVSASRRSDTRARIEFGVKEPKGAERILARKTFRTASVRYYPGEAKYHHLSLKLAEAGPLRPGRRYFFRISAGDTDPADALQVLSVAQSDRPGVGETLWGGAPVARTACFRLSGLAPQRRPTAYPIVEQSLARRKAAVLRARQTVAIPEPTTLSAVALLLGPTAGEPSSPGLCTLDIFAPSGRPLATKAFAPPKGNRKWTSLEFPPIGLKAGERIAIAIRAPRGRPLEVHTAGCDIYRGGHLWLDDTRQADDLCFKLYETPPHRGELPDIALEAVDFAPASPAAASPGGPLRLTVRAENRGTSPTGPFWIEFFAVPKDLSGPMAFLADSVKVPDIEPGDAWEGHLDRSLYPLADGLYAVIAVADRPGEVRESCEENNRAAAGTKDLLVIGRKARVNLYVRDFAVGATRLRRGRTIELRGLVSNNGKGAAGRFRIEFWASPDPDGRSGRFEICDPIVVESLAPDRILDLENYPRTLKGQMPTGRLYIGCTVDARDEIRETREWDNSAVTGPVAILP